MGGCRGGDGEGELILAAEQPQRGGRFVESKQKKGESREAVAETPERLCHRFAAFLCSCVYYYKSVVAQRLFSYAVQLIGTD